MDGSWGQVPLGCSVQSGVDWTAHYKTGNQGTGAACIHKNYQLVCYDSVKRCKNYEYRNCDVAGAYYTKCNLEGEYSPRQWKSTLKEAKQFCERHLDCKGITRDNNGFEPRKGPGVGNHVAARKLWLCRE